jgi:MFS family permease
VGADKTGYFFAIVAVANFLGPLLLGTLFDTLGRKPMISGTYLIAGALLLGTAWLFDQGHLSALTLTLCWVIVLFFASAGASSAYLTVSEVFPMETRALAIAFFYAIGTAAGGISGPLLFANLIKTGKVGDTALAFAIGAALMIAAGLVASVLGVKAEQKSLEDIATPRPPRKPMRRPVTKRRHLVTSPVGAGQHPPPLGRTGAADEEPVMPTTGTYLAA